MTTTNKTLIVGKIDAQEDRVLFYEEGIENFHIIASKKQADGIKEGDTIEYEPEGVNFGWFVSKKN